MIEVDAQIGQTGQAGGGAAADTSRDVRFIARSIELLSKAAERAAQGVRIRLFEASPLADIRKVLDAAPKGRGKVTLLLELDDGEEAEVELPGAWALSENVKSDLRQAGGGLEVSEY